MVPAKYKKKTPEGREKSDEKLQYDVEGGGGAGVRRVKGNDANKV